MNAIDKIKKWLREIKNVFPELKLKYVYEKEENSHYIYIKPNDAYLNGDFGKHALEFSVEFIRDFPDEYIGFLPMEEMEEYEHKKVLFDSEKPSVQQIIVINSSLYPVRIIKMAHQQNENDSKTILSMQLYQKTESKNTLNEKSYAAS